MKALITLTALFLLLSIPAAAADRPLNLLIITADDMNGDSAGYLGNPRKSTPNLDAFAITAHQFHNHHVTAPICQPSRSAFMTGRVPHASGALGFNPVREGTPSLVGLLKAQGYFTGVIDKHVHMQPESVFPWDEKLSGSGKNPPRMKEHMEELLAAARKAEKPFFINANITDPHRPFPGSAQEAAGRGARRQQNDDANEVADEEPKPRAANRPRQAARAARAGGNASPDDLGIKPITADDVRAPRFLENLPEIRTETAQYETAIARFDQSFGSIMESLREAEAEDTTVVVFLSDHGMSMPFSKATVYRNGTWSPLLLRYPGMGDPQVRPEFVSSVDLAPTLLEILGVDRPDGMNGRPWMPLLRGEQQIDRDFVITHVNTTSSGAAQPQRCIRTREWSLMFHAWPDGTPKFKVEAMNGLTFKALEKAGETDGRIGARVAQYRVGEPLMLFSQQNDPDERTNLIADPRYRAEAERLAGLLIEHMQRTGDPQLANFQRALELWRMQQ